MFVLFVSLRAYSLVVKQRSPKPPSQVRVLVGPHLFKITFLEVQNTAHLFPIYEQALTE